MLNIGRCSQNHKRCHYYCWKKNYVTQGTWGQEEPEKGSINLKPQERTGAVGDSHQPEKSVVPRVKIAVCGFAARDSHRRWTDTVLRAIGSLCNCWTEGFALFAASVITLSCLMIPGESVCITPPRDPGCLLSKICCRNVKVYYYLNRYPLPTR